ncbi:MAG TPA: tripartite tricarboxylate transporter substrate binding protein [Eoetvoesiella sp.]
MNKILRNWCGAVVLALCGVTGASAAVGSYPTKTITLIVPFAPGGPADVMGRMVAKILADTLGQSVVVVNKAGAGGNIGTDAIAKSDPDGYTLGISLISSLAIAPSLYTKLPYVVDKDIAPITMVGIATPAILAHPSAPFNTFDEMIRYAKANPGKLNYSTPGVGTAPHLAAEYLSSLAKIELVHVPYKGTAPASQDLLAGVIPVGFESSLVTASKFVDNGRLKAIAVMTKERSDLLPSVPTISELGYPGFDAANWFCLVAPANTPPEVIKKLNNITAAGLNNPDVIAKFAAIGVVAQSMSPQELAAYIDKETVHWRKIIVANNIKAE